MDTEKHSENSSTAVMKGRRAVLQKLAREALEVQNACNMSGIARSFVQVMDTLGSFGLSTGQRNQHPITVVWLDKMNSLASIQPFDSAFYGEQTRLAFKAVQGLADGGTVEDALAWLQPHGFESIADLIGGVP